MDHGDESVQTETGVMKAGGRAKVEGRDRETVKEY
jgi:hypothetical protein